MLAGVYNFILEQGASLQFELIYKLADCTPFDLTGYSGYMKIKAFPTSSQNSTDSYYGSIITCNDGCSTDPTQDFYNSLPSIFSSGSIILSSSLNPDGTGLNFYGPASSKPLTSGSINVQMSAETSSLFTFQIAKYELYTMSSSYILKLIDGDITINNKL